MNQKGLVIGFVCGLLIAAGATGLIYASGCTTTSPFSGKAATKDEIRAEADQAIREAQEKDRAVQAKAAQDIAAAQAQAKAALAKLNAQQMASAADIELGLEVATGAATTASNLSAQNATEQAAGINAKAAAAQAKIDQNLALVNGLWSIARPFTSLIPGAGPVVQDTGNKLLGLLAGFSTVGMVGAGAVAVKRGKKAEEETVRADMTNDAIKSIVNAFDVLRMKVPAAAEAMKANKGEMLTHMSDLAVKIIKEETLT